MFGNIPDTARPHALAPPARLLLIALLFLATAAATTAPARAETRPHYDMQVSLSYPDASLEVVQKTTFRNNTGGELPDLVFHVVPAYFDSFTLHSARVEGGEVAASRDGTVLELKLDPPLAPGDTAEVELRYQVRVPPVGGRFGRGQGILALGNWFPVLAVYRDGWDRHQYVDVGDAFFTESADFDVAVTSDLPVTIAASGQSMGQGEKTRSFRAVGVRDFAMAVSDRYLVRGREVDGVRVLAYGPSAPRLEVYLEEAEAALRWFTSNLSPYPYPTLSIAEIYADPTVPTAQEYPALIFVYSALGADGGGTGSYSEYTVAHEIAHQWFYSLVGNDQVHDPWLDEALATYASILFYKDRSPGHFEHYLSRAAAGYRSRAATGGDRPVNTTINDYRSDLSYFDIVYRKGAVFLDGLRRLMGDEAFLGLLQEHIQIHSGKVATPRAFLDLAYTRAGESLPPLIARYFSYGAFVDGAGYRLDVEWPERLAAPGPARLDYSFGLPVAEARVWLDSRMVYRGRGGGPIEFSLDGVEEGEYVMRLDLLDARGALYQRSRRVEVAASSALTPAAAPRDESTPLLKESRSEGSARQGEEDPADPWRQLRAMERRFYLETPSL